MFVRNIPRPKETDSSIIFNTQFFLPFLCSIVIELISLIAMLLVRNLFVLPIKVILSLDISINFPANLFSELPYCTSKCLPNLYLNCLLPFFATNIQSEWPIGVMVADNTLEDKNRKGISKIYKNKKSDFRLWSFEEKGGRSMQ
jgi:hypothetical protein